MTRKHLHKILFEKKLLFVAESLPVKPRLLTGALKRAIVQKFEKQWETQFAHLYLLIKHLEILNMSLRFLLVPYMHSAIHLTALSSDSLIKFVVNWETLLSELLEFFNPARLNAEQARMLHREILNYLKIFAHIIINDIDDPVAQNIRLNQLVDQTLHRIYNLRTGSIRTDSKNAAVKKELFMEDILKAIHDSDLSLLEKNNLNRIYRLIYQSSNHERLNRLSTYILQLISFKSKKSINRNLTQNCWESDDFSDYSQQKVLNEIETMLMSCIHEENQTKNYQ